MASSWSEPAADVNGESMQFSQHGICLLNGFVLEDTTDDRWGESDLISEAQAGPSTASVADHRRTSRIVPSEPDAYYLPSGSGQFGPAWPLATMSTAAAMLARIAG